MFPSVVLRLVLCSRWLALLVVFGIPLKVAQVPNYLSLLIRLDLLIRMLSSWVVVEPIYL